MAKASYSRNHGKFKRRVDAMYKAKDKAKYLGLSKNHNNKKKKEAQYEEMDIMEES